MLYHKLPDRHGLFVYQSWRLHTTLIEVIFKTNIAHVGIACFRMTALKDARVGIVFFGMTALKEGSVSVVAFWSRRVELRGPNDHLLGDSRSTQP